MKLRITAALHVPGRFAIRLIAMSVIGFQLDFQNGAASLATANRRTLIADERADALRVAIERAGARVPDVKRYLDEHALC